MLPIEKPPKLDNRFIQSIQGKEFVLYAGLLDLAHQKGLQLFEVELLQVPSNENNLMAICRATAVSKEGERFADIGDADPNNVTHKIVPHIIRMASTRAKARVLRDFCNIGICCVEELGDIDEGFNGSNTDRFNPSTRNGNGNRNGNGYRNGCHNEKISAPEPSNNGTCTSASHSSPPNGNHRTGKMSEAQNRAIINLAKRRNISDEELSQMIQNEFQTSLNDLSIQTASQLIQTLQKYS